MDAATWQLIATSAVIAAAVGGVLTLVGVVVTALFARDREARAHRWALDRERLQAQRTWDLERVRHTREVLWAYTDLLVVKATGDVDRFRDSRQIYDRARALPGFDVLVLADDAATRRYVAAVSRVLEMEREAGADRAVADAVVDAANALDAELSAQMNRAMSGQPLRELSPAVVEEFVDAALLPLPPGPQSTGARISRRIRGPAARIWSGVRAARRRIRQPQRRR